MLKITPQLLLFPYKVGTSFNQIAMPIGIKKQIIFSTKWVIKLLRDKEKRITLSNISNILLDSLENRGLSIEKKYDNYFIAEKNHYLIKYFK